MKTPAFVCLVLLSQPALRVSAAEALAIDPKNSEVSFTIQNKAPGAKEYDDVAGKFTDFSGEVKIDPADPAACSVEMEVETASIDTGNAKRDDHLRNQDFFKVKEHPKMTFSSTKVAKGSDGDYEVTGDFTLLDVTKPMTIVFKPNPDGKGGTTSFTVKRSDYGMDYRVPETADEVSVTLRIGGEQR